MKSGAFCAHLSIKNCSMKAFAALLFFSNLTFSSPLAEVKHDPAFASKYTNRFFNWYNDHIFSFSKYITEKDFKLVKGYLATNEAFYQTLPSGSKFQSFRIGLAKKEKVTSHILTLVDFKNTSDLESLLSAKRSDFPTEACQKQRYGVEFFLTEKFVEKNLIRICENSQGDFVEHYHLQANKKFKRVAKVQLNVPLPKGFVSKIASNITQLDEILLTKDTQYFIHNGALINERFMDLNDAGIINKVRTEFNLDPHVFYYHSPTKFIIYYP